jgi:Protein of unknown function (DUF3800)
MTSVKSMGGLLHPPLAKDRIIVALRAYFDESGTHWSGPKASNVFVLCGYIAQESVWDDKTENSFTGKWNNVMHGKPFHATEMESNPQGPDTKLALANLVNKCGIIGIGGGLSIPAYRRLMLPYIQKKYAPCDPYLFLFADVICEAVKQAEMFVGENIDEPVAFVFAAHKRWSLAAHEFYNSVKGDVNVPLEVRGRMGAIAFEDLDKFIPLQAADHLAFECYHYMNDPPRTWRPTMKRLMDWPQNHGRYYNEEGLLTYIQHCKAEGLFPND